MPDYREIEWRNERPSIAQFDDDLRSSKVEVIDGLDPRLEAVTSSLNRTHGHGGSLAAQFIIDAGPSVRWFLARNRLPESGFFKKFFSLDVVQDRFKQIRSIEYIDDDLGFALEAPFVTQGRLAHNIWAGGAYLRFEGSDAEVQSLVAGVADAAFGGRYSDVTTYESWKAWCPWFKDIAWDASFFWVDKRTGTLTILLITDTD